MICACFTACPLEDTEKSFFGHGRPQWCLLPSVWDLTLYPYKKWCQLF